MAIPYIGIYMTSIVINELSSQRRIWVLTASVSAAVILTFILTLVSAFMNKRISVGYSQLFSAHEIRLNEKANAMKYSVTALTANFLSIIIIPNILHINIVNKYKIFAFLSQ